MSNAASPTQPTAPAAQATPEERYAVFRERRDLAAVQPQGPLALVNTQWVDADQTIWGVPGRWAPAPEGGLLVTATAADGITVDGDRWCWHLSGIRALGVEVAPSFTERMTFGAPSRIEFRHDPPPGAVERAGAR